MVQSSEAVANEVLHREVAEEVSSEPVKAHNDQVKVNTMTSEEALEVEEEADALVGGIMTSHNEIETHQSPFVQVGR